MAGYQYGHTRQDPLTKALDQNKTLRTLLDDARKELRDLRTDRNRLQARIADLKKYRPQAPKEPATPRDEAEARLRAATNEITQWNRQRRANGQSNGRKKAA